MNETQLAKCVRKAVEEYFRDLDGEPPRTMYDMVMDCVEKPLLEAVLRHAGGNQTQAAQYLGLNRSTLRKKLKQHDIT